MIHLASLSTSIVEFVLRILKRIQMSSGSSVVRFRLILYILTHVALKDKHQLHVWYVGVLSTYVGHGERQANYIGCPDARTTYIHAMLAGWKIWFHILHDAQPQPP